MADAEVKVSYIAEIADLRTKLKETSGVTASEARAMVKSLDASVKAAAKAQTAAVKAFKQTAEASRDSAQAAQELQDRFGGLGDVARALGLGPLEGLADVGEALVRGFKDLGAWSTVVGGVAGIGAVTVAATAAGAAMIKAADVAEDYAKELKAFRGLEGFAVSGVTIASLERANASIDAIVTVGKQAVVVLGAELAPAIEEAGTQMVALGLMALDSFKAFAEGKSVLRELAVFLTDNLVKALLGPATGLAWLSRQMAALAEAAGMDGLAGKLRDADAAYAGFTRQLAETTVDYYASSDALTGLVEVSDDYLQRARELIGVQVQVGRETVTSSEAIKRLSEDLQQAADAAATSLQTYQQGLAALVATADAAALERLDGEARVTAELRAQLDSIAAQERALLSLAQTDSARETVRAEAARAAAEVERTAQAEIAAIRADAAEQQRKDAEAAAEQAARLRQQQIAEASAIAGSLTQATGALASALDSSYQNAANNANILTAQLAAGESYYTAAQEKELKRRIAGQRQAAVKAFNDAQAAKVAEAEMAAGLAFVNTLASNPTPFGLAQAFANLALAQTSVAAIASQKPAFHAGGLAEDEYPTLMRRGEAVLNPTGRQVVGDQGVRDANAGVAPRERPMVLIQQHRHRGYNAFIAENLKMGGPLSDAISASRTVSVGHRATRRAA